MRATTEATPVKLSTCLRDKLRTIQDQIASIQALAVPLDVKCKISAKEVNGKVYRTVSKVFPSGSMKAMGKPEGAGHREFQLGQKKTKFLTRVDYLESELRMLEDLAKQLQAEVSEYTSTSESHHHR